jgi:hypothetical protein
MCERFLRIAQAFFAIAQGDRTESLIFNRFPRYL